jgi:hypothetical protein
MYLFWNQKPVRRLHDRKCNWSEDLTEFAGRDCSLSEVALTAYPQGRRKHAGPMSAFGVVSVHPENPFPVFLKSI